MMDLLTIRRKANKLAFKNALKIVPIYIFVELVLLLLMMVSNQIISILLSLLFVTLPHAYVIVSLNAVEDIELDIKRDLFIGFTGYTRLFPSYFMRKLMINFVSILLVIPTIIIIQSKTSFLIGDLLTWVQMIVVSGVEDLSAISAFYGYLTSPLVITSFVLGIVLSSIISYGLAMIPYLVEKQDISWSEAIQKSWRMMRGHKKELFTLRLSYLPQMIIIFLTVQCVSGILSFSLFLSTFASLVLSIYLPIMLYQPHLEIANALFYKKLINKEENPDLFAL